MTSQVYQNLMIVRDIQRAMRTELHPKVKEILELEREQGKPKNYQLSAEGSRVYSHQGSEEDDPVVDPEVAETRDYLIPGPDGDEQSLPIRVYFPEDPANGPFPITVWLHGGGWVRGSLDSNDTKCRYLCTEIGCTVVAVDYRLAPEHKFPAALHDCDTAIQWVQKNSETVRGDPDRLAVAGSSAGGNLTAAVTLMARDRGGTPDICHQVLAAPVLDRNFETKAYRENAEGYGRTRQGRKVSWNQYLDREIDAQHPYAAPLRARDLSDLPPATVITGGFDPGRDDGRNYADRLQSDGVSVSYTNYPDMPHRFTGSTFLRMGMDRTLEAYDEIVTDLSDRFAE